MLLSWMMLSAGATDWSGGDYAGADIVVEDGDTLVGTFTNVGRLEVPLGATAIATDLHVEASFVVIRGHLSGSGQGEAGGDEETAGQGAGGGGVGAGGGFGGVGGDGPPTSYGGFGAPGGFGGASYGEVELPELLPGSGGGGGMRLFFYSPDGGTGGAGGGVMKLVAEEFYLDPAGLLSVDGWAGEPGEDVYGTVAGSGGGGSGGSLWVEASTLRLDGTLSAQGGMGAGGGGGGRIVVMGPREGSPGVNVAGGGLAGRGMPTGSIGEPGTFYEELSGLLEDCDDADLDGVCDSDDLCAGDDASGDADSDGHCAENALGEVADCDDADASSFPGAPELCDGLDNACVGRPPADEQDLDGDGVSICEGDCDDLDPDDVCGSISTEERALEPQAESSGGCAVVEAPTSWFWMLSRR